MVSGYVPDGPIAAVATALAPSALGVIRTSGAPCIELVSRMFSRPQALLAAEPYTMVYGWICGADGGRIDEVLLGVFHAPRSFTGEDMVEIYCHGGPAVVLAVYKRLLAGGFREAQKGEFTFRAFVNGKTDLTRAEAVNEIICSQTDESRSRAAGRLSGSLYAELREIRDMLVHTLASIEAEIEYPEDEESIADAFDSSELCAAEQRLAELCASWKCERLYQDGASVVLCGKTNAGKSSLFNMLLKEERAIVSDIHGTTRDWLECGISFDGMPARIFDTAGLRETEDIIERYGVERTESLTESADLVLYVIDGEKGICEDDAAFLEGLLQLHETLPILVVFNKNDIVPVPAGFAVRAAGRELPSVSVSAKTGNGTEALSAAVRSLLGAAKPDSRGRPGLGSERQKKAADEALCSVRHALSEASPAEGAAGCPLDAVVQDIEDALDFLGEITGAVTAEDILDTVFSRFCLGK